MKKIFYIPSDRVENLKSVTVYGYDDGDEDGRISRLLREPVFQNPNVKELCFLRTRVDLEELCNGVRNMKSLESLDFGNYIYLENADENTFTRLLRSNRG